VDVPSDEEDYRDYLAAKAMQALILKVPRPLEGVRRWQEGIARDAFDIADAMIVERNHRKVAAKKTK